MSWLDGNSLAEQEEIKHYIEELNKECMPIMSKLYAGGAAPGPQMPGTPGAPNQQQGPTVEEMD